MLTKVVVVFFLERLVLSFDVKMRSRGLLKDGLLVMMTSMTQRVRDGNVELGQFVRR